METIKSGNQKGWHKSPPAKVPENELLCDVPTCWDSVYLMLNRLRVLRLVSTYSFVEFFPSAYAGFIQAVNYFLSLPEQAELLNYKLTNAEWHVLHDFERILQVGWYEYLAILTTLTNHAPLFSYRYPTLCSNQCHWRSFLVLAMPH